MPEHDDEKMARRLASRARRVFTSASMDVEDLRQEARLALWSASQDYDAQTPGCSREAFLWMRGWEALVRAMQQDAGVTQAAWRAREDLPTRGMLRGIDVALPHGLPVDPVLGWSEAYGLTEDEVRVLDARLQFTGGRATSWEKVASDLSMGVKRARQLYESAVGKLPQA